MSEIKVGKKVWLSRSHTTCKRVAGSERRAENAASSDADGRCRADVADGRMQFAFEAAAVNNGDAQKR